MACTLQWLKWYIVASVTGIYFFCYCVLSFINAIFFWTRTKMSINVITRKQKNCMGMFTHHFQFFLIVKEAKYNFYFLPLSSIGLKMTSCILSILPWPTCASPALQVLQIAEISDVHLVYNDSKYPSGLDQSWYREIMVVLCLLWL